MNLSELKGDYDGFYSLGSNCYPAQRLERYGLRPYSGVIDWMYSNSVAGLVKLLNHRFDSFMHPANMVIEGTMFDGHNYSVRDCFYDIESVHDFLVSEQVEGYQRKLPEFRQTMERRVNRLLHKAEHCQKLLFVRLHASFVEASVLEGALTKLVKHQFRLLVVNPGPKTLHDLNWPLPHTCGLQLPIEWDAESDMIWNEVFRDIRYIAPSL
ncbi:DUF1796 family putative cysteine peptidase [Paenibacillus aquistagni]|uniref:DUF1796 family putative cysteine peptidase n=1 Tax=Paenibacillus aquistagni TaxID=1852522 RepID=UPI000B50F5C0|nr:DUF1796 family putative cysteine peptidase [Paenibacillus aquistagni]